MMVNTIYEQTIRKLASGGIELPRLEARLLISNILRILPDEVNTQTIVPKDLYARLDADIQKRLLHMPMDKILGHKEFYKYDFIVSKDVLSPRPDTEILLESALKIASRDNCYHVLELGVGSGCVLLSLLKEITDIQGVGIDISSKALSIAQQNAHRLDVENRCRLICQDWFEDDFLNTMNEKFDLIISNPPYIPSGEIDNLSKEVKSYDPLLALDGGKDGLIHYRRIAEFSKQLLNFGGYALFEVGLGQATDVQRIFEYHGLKHQQTLSDLAGIERVVVFQYL